MRPQSVSPGCHSIGPVTCSGLGVCPSRGPRGVTAGRAVRGAPQPRPPLSACPAVRAQPGHRQEPKQTARDISLGFLFLIFFPFLLCNYTCPMDYFSTSAFDLFKTRQLYKYHSSVFSHFAVPVQLMYCSNPLLFFFFQFFPGQTGTPVHTVPVRFISSLCLCHHQYPRIKTYIFCWTILMKLGTRCKVAALTLPHKVCYYY